MTGWRVVLAIAVVAHGVVLASVVSQPIDTAVPPQTPRSVVWRCCYDSVTWPGPGVDFFAVYHAGVQVRRGASPYDRDENPATTPYYFRYLYAPGLAHTLGAWLATLPPGTAYRVWALGIELSLLLFLACWWRSPSDDEARRFGTVMLLLSTPYFLELHVGQFTFVATALCAAAVLLAPSTSARQMTAAGLFFAGVFLKLFPLAGVPALRTRESRALLTGALAAGMALLAGVALYPDDSRQLLLLNAMDDTALPHPGHMSLLHVARVGLLATGIPVSAAVWATIAPATLLAGMAAVAALVWRWRLDGAVAFVLLLMAFLLLFYRAGEHHWSAVVLLSALGWSLVNPTRFSHHEVALGRVCLVLLATPTVFPWLAPDAARWSTAETLLLPSMKVLPGLLLFALLLKSVRPADRPLS
jgi:hypothetical protein